MTNSLDMEALGEKGEDLDIDALDDSQLYEMLKENNIVAGPIVDSTRNVYKKRLRTVLYGNDEAEEGVIASDGESEEGSGANDRESEEEVEASDEEEQKDEEAIDRDTNHEEPPMEMNDEDNEEVLADAEEPYENKSDTEDDQPSGISRPVPSSGLRKRFPETVPDSTQTDGENITGMRSGTGGKMETSSGWIPKAVLSLMGVGIMAGLLYFISSLDFEVPETVDSMQEAIQEAANKAADEV